MYITANHTQQITISVMRLLPFINSVTIYSLSPLLGRSKCLRCDSWSQRAHSVMWKISTPVQKKKSILDGSREMQAYSVGILVSSGTGVLAEPLSSGFRCCIGCVCKIECNRGSNSKCATFSHYCCSFKETCIDIQLNRIKWVKTP